MSQLQIDVKVITCCICLQGFVTDIDPRTSAIIQQMLGDTPGKQRFAHALSAYVILKSVHQDEVVQLQEQLDKCRPFVPLTEHGRFIDRPSTTKSTASSSSGSSGGSMDDETAAKGIVPSSQRLDMYGYQEQIKKLNHMLEKAQSDLSAANKDADTHLDYIHHLSGKLTDRSTPSTPTGMPEERLDDLIETNKELNERIVKIHQELTEKDSQLNEAMARLKKVKATLGIPADFPDSDIDSKLAAYVKANKRKKDDFDKLKSQLQSAQIAKEQLTNETYMLRTKVSTLHFEIRQNENTISRISRGKRQAALIPQEEKVETAIKATSFNMADFDYIQRGPMANIKFCIICRNEYLPTSSTTCRTHTKPLRKGLWSCCKNPSYRGLAGCKIVPHLYVEKAPDKSVRITDGVREMEISD